MPDRSYIEVFDPEGKSKKYCATCGLCLQKCPVMKMDKAESVAEMARLIKGEDPKRVLKECTFCFSCNNYCPNGLSPYALIMERLSDSIKGSEKGFPPHIDYVFLHKGKDCLVFDIYDQEPEENQAILAKWEVVPPKSEEVLFCGCNGRQIPYGIEHSEVLKELPKYSPRQACCGEIPFRCGDFETFSKNVEKTSDLFGKLDTKRMVCYCGSCASMIKNFWTKYHGTHLPFEVTSLWEWLWEKVKKGDLSAKRKVPIKVALTDSCYSSEMGENFYQAVRGLHEAVGMTVVELTPNRYDGLCCGTLSFVRNGFDFAEAEKTRMKKMAQIVETGATEISCYCPGCFGSLREHAKQKDMNMHFSLEEILWAFGDEYPPGAMEQGKTVQSRTLQEKIIAYMTGDSA